MCVLAAHQLDNGRTLSHYFHLNLKIVQERPLQKNTTLFLTIDHCAELKRTVGPWSPQQCHSEACLIMNKNDSCVGLVKSEAPGLGTRRSR